jgi:hypothetical protein
MRRNFHTSSLPSSATFAIKPAFNRSPFTQKQQQPKEMMDHDEDHAEFSSSSTTNFQCPVAAIGIGGTSGFDLFEEEDKRRENAFKAVLVITLCITGYRK